MINPSPPLPRLSTGNPTAHKKPSDAVSAHPRVSRDLCAEITVEARGRAAAGVPPEPPEVAAAAAASSLLPEASFDDESGAAGTMAGCRDRDTRTLLPHCSFRPRQAAAAAAAAGVREQAGTR